MFAGLIMALEISIAATNHTIPGDFNEVHLTARQDFGNAFVTAFHNSEDALSLGVGYTFERELTPRLDGFCDLALVTGYEYASVLPMARCGVEVYGRSRLWIAPAATPEGDIGAVFGAELILLPGK